MHITDWLRGLGLEQYAPGFRENDIDGKVLRRLTAEDLRELGIASVGHRRHLLDAIAALETAEASPAPAPAAVVSGEAERRQLTVMFCDLVGSTPLSLRYDPEDLREIVGAYHRCVAGTVGRFGGFVAKYMGDRVLVSGEPGIGKSRLVWGHCRRMLSTRSSSAPTGCRSLSRK